MAVENRSSTKRTTASQRSATAVAIARASSADAPCAPDRLARQAHVDGRCLTFGDDTDQGVDRIGRRGVALAALHGGDGERHEAVGVGCRDADADRAHIDAEAYSSIHAGA
ncbi:hypothetical protein GCM10025876_39270 [Demequina litorisediminis]|uniref:Uncharacterized protein n=1 Tax=Demequina litorisediminis TaxID=1849022 RepID=A0ABQ6IKP1_9MICO|nr:hypothetical protein GCM10025876_39270 [Demequina litorisediminis]